MVQDGKIEIGVTGEIEAKLQELDPELNLENTHSKPDNANEIREILKSSVNSFVLRILQEHSQELKLTESYIETIIDALITNVLSPDEKGNP